MEYFVTGGTGFVGGALVDQLVDAGHDVVALARDPAGADLPNEVEIVAGDVTEKASMRDAVAGVDGVFHVAGWYQVGDPDPAVAEAVNVDGTRNVLELVDELDVPKAVYTSTLAVFSDTRGRQPDESYRYDGPHLTVYDRTKWRAHYEVAEPMAAAGVPVVTVMPGLVYGPGDRGPTWALWEGYLTGSLPAIPSRGGYCWGHVEDTARAHRRAMADGTPGETYILAGEPYALPEVMAMAEELTGVPAPRTLPPWTFGALSRVAAAVERVIDPPVAFQSETLRVLAGATYFGDNAKAERELGLEHRPLREGLEGTLAEAREALGD